MGKDAVKIGANTLQFFLRNPRGGRAKALDPEDIAKFLAFAKENGIGSILAHASYTLNPATTEERLIKFVRETMADDLARMEHTPGNMYNIHPGHAKDGDRERAATTIAETLDYVIKPEHRTTLLLETMVGNAGEMGGRFEELRAIIDRSTNAKRLGVCLDTCHVFAAGYDVVNDLDGVLTRFDKALGLKRLKAVHLNDSMYGLGEGKDRHAKLGEGKIGLSAMGRIVNHPALRELPFYLETPNDLDGYAHEIAELKKLYGKAEKAPAKRKPAPGTPAKPVTKGRKSK